MCPSFWLPFIRGCWPAPPRVGVGAGILVNAKSCQGSACACVDGWRPAHRIASPSITGQIATCIVNFALIRTDPTATLTDHATYLIHRTTTTNGSNPTVEHELALPTRLDWPNRNSKAPNNNNIDTDTDANAVVAATATAAAAPCELDTPRPRRDDLVRRSGDLSPRHFTIAMVVYSFYIFDRHSMHQRLHTLMRRSSKQLTLAPFLFCPSPDTQRNVYTHDHGFLLHQQRHYHPRTG